MFPEAHRPRIIGDRLLTGNSRVPASEKRHLQLFRVFLNALLCGPWGLGFGLPRSGFASGAFRFHLDSFDDLIDARLAIGGLVA